jgi:hypothetical protein
LAAGRYGPTLGALAGPVWARFPRALRLGLLAILVLVLGVAAVYGWSRLTRFETVEYSGPEAPNFTMRFLKHDVERERPKGDELVRLNSPAPGGAFRQRLIVSPLALDPREGSVGPQLALAANEYLSRAQRRYHDYRPVEEGRLRLNGIEGYQLVFTATYIAPSGTERQLFGRIALLPEQVERPRRGIAVEVLATTLSQVRDAPSVGNRGPMATPFRSLRYR